MSQFRSWLVNRKWNLGSMMPFVINLAFLSLANQSQGMTNKSHVQCAISFWHSFDNSASGKADLVLRPFYPFNAVSCPLLAIHSVFCFLLQITAHINICNILLCNGYSMISCKSLSQNCSFYQIDHLIKIWQIF